MVNATVDSIELAEDGFPLSVGCETLEGIWEGIRVLMDVPSSFCG